MRGISETMWNGLMGRFLYVPIFNILILLYTYIPGHDLGLAIITLTIIVRLILHPSYVSTLKSQRDMQRIQPYIAKIREEYKDDPKKQNEEIMKVYQEHRVNPFSSCLPLIIQLPLVLALYRVFVAGLDHASLVHLYTWFPNPPTELNTIFLRFTENSNLMIDLTQRSIPLAILAGVAPMIQGWLTIKYPTTKSTGGMSYLTNLALLVVVFPLITFFIALSLPSALSLYWATATCVMIVEQQLARLQFLKQERALEEATKHG